VTSKSPADLGAAARRDGELVGVIAESAGGAGPAVPDGRGDVLMDAIAERAVGDGGHVVGGALGFGGPADPGGRGDLLSVMLVVAAKS
jgi:hypothetical protein